MPTALVTGAGRGIGAAFADRLARDGHDLVLVDRDREPLESVAEAVRARGVAAEVLVADLTDTDALAAVRDRLADAGRPVDLLVNSAGVKYRAAFTEADEAGLQAEVDTNVTAVLQLTRAALPGMVRRRGGAVVNLASFAGYLAGPGDPYAATKAWVISFTDTMARAVAGSGVRMIVSCPGPVDTPMLPPRQGNEQRLSPEEVVDTCLADLARGRTVSVPDLKHRAVVDVLELPRRTLRTAARLAGRGKAALAARRR